MGLASEKCNKWANAIHTLFLLFSYRVSMCAFQLLSRNKEMYLKLDFVKLGMST